MASSLISYNHVGAQCILTPSDSCLYQVAGYTDNDPEAQLSACQSLFGFPTVPTVTLSAERVFSTDIATAIYTDIVTSTDTLHLTATETLTETVTISDTETQYTTTLVNILSTTDVVTVTTRAVVTTAVPPARLRRRGGCRGRTSSSLPASSVEPSAALSSSVSSSTAASATASACPNEAAYSSACACLALPTVTESSGPITSVIRQTETSTVTSTIYTTATEVTTQTAVADDPVTTTTTATEYTNTQTTTTATTTTTVTVQPPIPTDVNIRSNEQTPRNMYMSGNGRWYGAYLSPLPGNVTPLKLASPNTQPTNPWDAGWKLYVLQSMSGTYQVGMTTAQMIPTLTGIAHAITCSVEEDTMLFKCRTGSPSNLEKFVACGDAIYMLGAGVTPATGCAFIELGAVQWQQ